MDQRLQARQDERALVHRPLFPLSRAAPQSPRLFTSPQSPSAPPPTPSPRPSEPEIEPMEVARSRLTVAEREQCMQGRLCLYCGQGGHFIRDCASCPKVRAY